MLQKGQLLELYYLQLSSRVSKDTEPYRDVDEVTVEHYISGPYFEIPAFCVNKRNNLNQSILDDVSFNLLG